MTKGDAAIIVAYLVALYPGWNATTEVLEMVGDLFTVEVLEVDDGKAIVKDHAAKFEWPNAPGIAAAIRAAVNRKIGERNAAQAKAASASPSEHHKSITEWRDWYRDTPDGREEWKRLPANIRRGLRSMWKGRTA